MTNVRRVQRLFFLVVLAFIVLLTISWPGGQASSSVEQNSPFRYSGDGVLPLSNIFTHENVTIRFRNTDGTYNEQALEKIDHMLACHLNQEELPISLKLIELVDYLQDHFNSSEVQVISGYRSPEYNAKLRHRLRRVARHSFHMAGRAMDLKLAGVDSRVLRNYTSSLQAGGVGYYGRNRYLHVDSGPVRTW